MVGLSDCLRCQEGLCLFLLQLREVQQVLLMQLCPLRVLQFLTDPQLGAVLPPVCPGPCSAPEELRRRGGEAAGNQRSEQN